ncbi:MAG: Maf family protein, partial [Acidimicrobiia bacterium]|nr:Maf family protein [Acidimicrobiia bacterium]
DVDESVLVDEQPAEYVERVARAKAASVNGGVVLAADTTVVIDGEILGKPSDPAEARSMLAGLQGRSHLVYTAVAVHAGSEIDAQVVRTEVRMAPMSPATIDWYVGTGEPLDKAGAYGLQGIGMAFVAAVSGSVSNVIGLPLDTTLDLLARHGITVVS